MTRLRESWDRLQHVIVKEIIQTLRDPRMRVILVAPPILQLVVYGYAFNMDITDIRMAVADFDRTQESRELTRRFDSSGYFRVVRQVRDGRALTDLIDGGTVKVGLQFDPGFADHLRRGRTAVIQLLVDGTDSNTASVVGGYANRIIRTFNRERSLGAVAPADARRRGVLRIEVEARTWYNPDLRSRNFFVPGVIAMVLMLTCLQLTSMAVVREREIGTLDQLLVTPLRPVELILGKALPFALVGFAHTALVTAVAVFWFDVPIRGSLALLFGATLLYLLSALGAGLFISTLARTQQQALMAMFFLFLPLTLFSGFIFPIADMPQAVQVLTLANPLRHFLVIVRAVFLKGTGLSVLWGEMLALLVLGVLVLAVSIARFQQRLE